MKRKWACIIRITFVLVLLVSGCTPERQVVYTNLSHLNHLYEEVERQGESMAIVHIYSRAPQYYWIGDEDEGIACVDDAARAVVVYLRHAELFQDAGSLHKARQLIKFILSMQAENGLFYNFIWPDLSVNRDGPTSINRLDWWTARAVWALSTGIAHFADRDSVLTSRMIGAISRVFPHLDTLMARYPQVETFRGYPVPLWLMMRSAADATSEMMLGLIAFYQHTRDPGVRAYLNKFAEGCLIMQRERTADVAPGLFLSWRNVWHAWGNSQAWAISLWSELQSRNTWKEAAMLEVEAFYPYVLERNFLRAIRFQQTDAGETADMQMFPQIAYGIRPMFMAAWHLFQQSGNVNYRKTAAELATWFFGGNPARQRMYDLQTGRCFDGILSPEQINWDSGAESTIEALMVMLEIDANPVLQEEIKRAQTKIGRR